ncbi:MAG: hypothetical protein NUW02_01450 [Candidatus Campbellbacteria bacterium]|nr:hypothetical protein [Candidatus Campbellbacteria bacterium]
MSIKKSLWIIMTIAAVIAGAFVFYKKLPSLPASPIEVVTPSAIHTWETKIDEQAGVTVSVTPEINLVDSQEWKFDIIMDTHSVELDQNMTEVAVLVDDFGNEYGPTTWEGAPVGGHHRGGVLVFTPIVPYPQHLKLNIQGVGGVQRSFSWILTE